MRRGRRQFLGLGGRAAGLVAVTQALGGCADDAGPATGSREQDTSADSEIEARFAHGIASGDPTNDAVVLWTRVTPLPGSESGPQEVRWSLARDAGMQQELRSGRLTTDAGRDFTVKVDVTGLEPGGEWFYRFAFDGIVSPVGRARTLASGSLDRARFAVVSCANYRAGWFNAYAHIAARNDLDAVLHLGDYLYEDGDDGFASSYAAGIGRAIPAADADECLSLTDYRRRYRTYRRDVDLRAMHARYPMIAVRDDHEVANNVWRDGAQGHGAGEGVFQTRLRAAVQAWHEWLPVRDALTVTARPGETHPLAPAAVVDLHETPQWRRFDIGNLATLIMLDARQAGRDEAVDRNDYLDPSGPTLNATEYEAALADSNRKMLGDTQFAWLENQLASSTARWQILGQQVPMCRLRVPAELRIDPATRYESATVASLAALTRRRRGDPSMLSAAERERLDTTLPYYQDGWEAYAPVRERLLRHALANDCRLVSLAGDTHVAWAADLTLDDGTAAGVEFATTAVTSPGIGYTFDTLTSGSARALEASFAELLDDVQGVNVLERGYLMLELTPEAASAEWIFMERTDRPTSTRAAARLAARTTGEARRLV